MHKDLQHWVKCKVSIPNIVKLLNRKYEKEGAKARYQDVYGLVKQITAIEKSDQPGQECNPLGMSQAHFAANLKNGTFKECESEFELLMEHLQRC